MGLTIPSYALLGVLVGVVGLGVLPSVIMLVFFGVLPILRNVLVGLGGVDASLVESARGMGMGRLATLVRVELPLTLPVILVLAGVAWPGGCGLRSSSGTVLAAEPGIIRHHGSLTGVRITVAAKSDTEQLILGNMVATILKTAGADVVNRSNIPGSFGVRQAMLTGTADISPDYTGTAWIEYLGNENPIKDEHGQWQAVHDADRPTS